MGSSPSGMVVWKSPCTRVACLAPTWAENVRWRCAQRRAAFGSSGLRQSADRAEVMTEDKDWMMSAKHLPALHLSATSVVAWDTLMKSSRSLECRTNELDSFQSL
jgi:hypothetical protein